MSLNNGVTRRTFLKGVAGGLAVGGLAATMGYRTQGQPLEIAFWHHEAPAYRVAAFQKMIDAFNQEHADIQVRQEVVSWGDAWPRTLSAIRSGATPDLQFDIPELNITAFEAGGITPLTDLVNEIDQQYGFINSQLRMYEHSDEIWGVPIWTMPMALIYRPSFLQQHADIPVPPRTWSEWLELARTLTTNGLYGIGLGAGPNLMVNEQAWCFMAPSGTELFDEDGNVTFNAPETVRAVELYRQLSEFSPPGSTGWLWGEMELNFGAGKHATMPYFGGLQKRFREDLGSTDLAGAPLPIPAERGYAQTLTYPNAVHVFKSATRDSTRMQAVFEFIRFMCRPDINTIITADQEPGSFVPVTEATMASDSPYWEHPTIEAFLELNQLLVREIRYGTLYGYQHGVVNFGIGDIIGENVLGQVIERAVVGGQSAQRAVSWGQQRMEELSRPVK